MRPSTSSTRPPAQYVVDPGTQFRLVQNEYDKNTYAQCTYSSYRTLIRCKEIRSKEFLARNQGKCEEHLELARVFSKNHKKEAQRCHAENDSKMQRRRFDPWIVSNEYISDEDDFLQPVSSVPDEVAHSVNDNLLDDHPLRYAGVFTDKDVIRIKMDLLQKDIDDLTDFKELIIKEAQKEHEAFMHEDEEDAPRGMAQRRAHNVSQKYSRSDYLTLTTVDPVYKQCCVGPDMEDSLVVAHLVQEILDTLDDFHPIPIETQCTKPAIHLSKFCIDHITLDRKQRLFEMCGSCGLTAIGGLDPPSCNFHIKSPHRRKGVGGSRCFAENRAHLGTVMCRCHRCIPGDGGKEDDPMNKIDINTSEDEEDTKLGNLSRIENMISPMQQFGQALPAQLGSPSHLPTSSRRYHGTPAQVLRPPQMGPPGSSNFPSKTAAQRVVANMRDYPQVVSQQARQRYEAEQLALKQQEEEAKTMTCARVRPADPNQFGSGKKKQQQQLKQVISPSSSVPYQLNQPKMPSILAPPTATSSSSAPQIRSGAPFSGWRNSPATPRTIHQMQSTRFPVQTQRGVPKTIPLERVQEPKNADELVEDRGSSPLPNYPGTEPARRGVPYYKNVSAYRRTEIPTRPGHLQQQQHQQPQMATSSSSAPQFHPPPPPPPPNHPPRYRPSNRPVPPHRAIAAGLNPADSVNASTPRPSFTAPRQQQPPGPQGVPAGPPLLAQFTPAHAQYRQNPRGLPPNRLLAGGSGPGGSVGGSPSRITTSYTVVGSGSRGSPSIHPSRLTPTQGRFSNQALDTARNDARFANMNVKTFLAMGNKDLSTMTQEEIDLIAASTDPAHKRKSLQSQTASVVQSPTTSPRREMSGGGQLPETSEPQAGPPAPASRSVKKRKIEETVEGAEVPEEPSAKKEMDKPKLTSPGASGASGASRTPRAAAIAANQAIAHHKPTPSGSTGAGASGASAQSSQEDTSSIKPDSQPNPLDLLAELSEAAAAEEQQNMETPAKSAPKKASPKTSSATSGASTSSKNRDGSEEL